MYTLSIIIPCFNSEKTITKTLFSLMNFLDYTDKLEIIIINDGSNDSTEKKALNFFENKSFNFLVHNQPNVGLSGARNKGLNLSKGKYIWFLDSDDLIISEKIDFLMNSLTSEVDLYYFPIIEKKKGIERVLENSFLTKSRLIGSPYYIFKRKFLVENNLFFKLGLIHEDLEFLPRVLNKLDSWDEFKFPLYKRIITENSITTSKIKFKRVKSLLDISLNHYYQYSTGNAKYFGFYSLVSLNSAFGLSFKLSKDDFRSFQDYLDSNINRVNLILKIKGGGISKLKSFISIFYFNFLNVVK